MSKVVTPTRSIQFLDEVAVAAYDRDGYVLVENLFSQPEVAAMLAAITTSERVNETILEKSDAGGRRTRLAIWHELGDDIWAAASTCPRVVNPIRILLGEEIAFFHGKVMLKEARSGGAWEWHQDYGYWYDQGFAFPRLMSVFVALDPARLENGCLQVLRGSHRLARLSHGEVAGQTGADPGRIGHLEDLFERVAVEMSPGSALFFHCNLLHTSAPNNSDYHRRSFIICYNALANPQLNERKLASLEPCPVGGDGAILEYGLVAQTPN